MADILEKTKKAADEAAKWVAAEFYYTKEFREDLEALKTNLESGKTYLRKARQAKEYVGKAESRATRAENQLTEDIDVLKKAVPLNIRTELDDVENNMEVVSRKLLQTVSRYEGHMNSNLKKLEKNVGLFQANAIKETKVQAIIAEIIEDINEILNWLSTMQADIKKIKSIEKKIEEWAK